MSADYGTADSGGDMSARGHDARPVDVVALLRALAGAASGITPADRLLERLLGPDWRTRTDADTGERLTGLPLRDLQRLASCLDLDHTDFLRHLLHRTDQRSGPGAEGRAGTDPEDDRQDDAWELHGLLLHVGAVGARHTEAAEALDWPLRRLLDAARALTGLLAAHPRYELAYHPDGRLHLRATGHRLSRQARTRFPGDPLLRLPLSAEHAAVLLAADTVLPLPDELPQHLVRHLIDTGMAIIHTDGTLVLSPDVDLATSAQPLPPPEDAFLPP
jgi:hypothetical protein